VWSLSPIATSTIQELYQLARAQPWFSQEKRDEQIRSILVRLAELKDVAAIPRIARFVLLGSPKVQAAARQVIADLLSTLAPYELLSASEHLSDWSYHWYELDEWYKLGPADVSRVAGNPNESAYSSLLGLLSFHWNGYVRHRAVNLLSEQQDGSELSFLILRQNDWVEPIAKEARVAVAHRTTDTYVPHFIRSLRLVIHLNSVRRRDHHDFVHRVLDLLLKERHCHQLEQVIDEGDPVVNRYLVQYGLSVPGSHRGRLIRLAIRSDDPVVRLNCCRSLPDAYSAFDLERQLEIMLKDRFMPVRREAFRLSAEQSPSHEEDLWKRALLDQSRSLREFARYSLKKLGYSEERIAANYRAVIANSPENLSALQGLAETGTQTDTDLFQRLLQHEFPSRRVVGIQGLTRLNAKSTIPVILPLLSDCSPRVVREVSQSLSRVSYLVAGEELMEIALHAPGSFARSHAVRTIVMLGKWQSLPWLLSIASISESDVAAVAEEELLRWLTPPKCNKVFTSPSSSEREMLISVLERARGHAPEEILNLVRDTLQSFS